MKRKISLFALLLCATFVTYAFNSRKFSISSIIDGLKVGDTLVFTRWKYGIIN